MDVRIEQLKIDKLWLVGAALAGALLTICLPRLVPKIQSGGDTPYPRAAEHAEV